jgi:hypothetical protein
MSFLYPKQFPNCVAKNDSFNASFTLEEIMTIYWRVKTWNLNLSVIGSYVSDYFYTINNTTNLVLDGNTLTERYCTRPWATWVGSGIGKSVIGLITNIILSNNLYMPANEITPGSLPCFLGVTSPGATRGLASYGSILFRWCYLDVSTYYYSVTMLGKTVPCRVYLYWLNDQGQLVPLEITPDGNPQGTSVNITLEPLEYIDFG